MRALVIGDIGVLDGMMHIGDEAMFEVASEQLRARGARVTGVSANPSESGARYGIPTVPRLGFAGLPRAAARERAALLVSAAADGTLLADGDPASGALDELRSGAGLVVAGGGNLASRWPEHVVERSTLAAMARALGRPVVVSGQTLGPDLEPADAGLVAGMLHGAELAGVREPDSLALAASWGASARLGVDDASFLGFDSEAGIAGERSGVLVSLSGWFGGLDAAATEQALAALIDAAAQSIEGPVRFHAHFGPADAGAAPRGDAALHERIRSRMRGPSEVVPTGDARSSAALARSASLLITSRYHPAVFAAPAGVPVLGLVADDYTRIKLRGAIGHWAGAAADAVARAGAGTAPGSDAGSTAIDLADVATGGAAAVEALLAAAPGIRAAADERRPAHRAAASAWWDAVATAIGGRPTVVG